MDPDLVRQQEEAEAEHRRGGKMPPPPAQKNPVPPPIAERTILSRAKPPLANLSQPSRGHAPAARPRLAPWLATGRAMFGGTAMAALGIFGGMLLGAKLGLVLVQQFMLGAGTGTVVGWQSAALALRRSGYRASVSLLATILPIVLVAGAMTAGIIIAVLDLSAVTMEVSPGVTLKYWQIVAIGAAVATATAAPTLRMALGGQRTFGSPASTGASETLHSAHEPS
jgi:hypothetical protein